MPNSPEDILKKGLEIMGLELADEQEALRFFGIYFQELKKWNRKYNLVARNATDLQILENHFLDSLTLLPLVQAVKTTFPMEKSCRPHLMDVGTGAGFPGMVLKIARPQLATTLVEPRQKRTSFLKHIIRTLRLGEIEVLSGRLGDETDLSIGPVQAFSYITSRALTDLAAFLTMVAPYSMPSGLVFCMKGPKGLEEAKHFQQEEKTSPYRLLAINEWRLPFSQARRFVLVFQHKEGKRQSYEM